MTKHQWSLEETFYFPVEYGAFAEAAELKVTPGFTEERTDEAIRLQGIYHIAANIVFDADKQISVEKEDLLVIEDVEVKNNKGYFEYAVPLNVDLPAEMKGQLDLKVDSVEALQQADGGLHLKWNILLHETIEEIAEEAPEVAETPAQSQVAVLESPSTSHLDLLVADKSAEAGDEGDFIRYIAALDDDVTKKIFHSNNVFVEAE